MKNKWRFFALTLAVVLCMTVFSVTAYAGGGDMVDSTMGDLIFFEKTYDTAGASHVGIYVGNNRMLHCGDPIHYASIDTSYWRSHFLQFGRLP